jgi:hypothetical protein
MRKKLFFTFMVIAVIAVMASCKSKKSETVDPIWETTPVTNAFYTDANGNENFPLDRFHELGQAGDTAAQRALVDQYRKQLTSNVVRQYPQITDENNIHFILGSGFAKDVKSGDGKIYNGKFKNELIIIINDPAIKDTVFLACGNGMLSPLGFSDRHDFGQAEKWRFVILPGEGLAHHLPELQAWAKVAGDLNIPIRNKDGKVVSQETYLHYLGKYESVLFPYDVIDVLNGKVYNQAGQEVQFERRLAETQKANAKITTKPKKRRR